MEREYGYLLELLGAFLQERAPRRDPEANWEDLSDLAQIHSVTGILGYMNMRYHLCPDERVSGDLRRRAMNTMLKYTQRGEAADRFSEMLRRAGIEHIRMKGAVLRRYYPVPELRTYGDIDLVIHPRDREKSHRLLLEAGFTPKVDWGPVYSYLRGLECYEIHTDIMETNVSDKADYRGYFAGMWQHTHRCGDGNLEFTPEYHFLYLLTHVAKHIRGAGAGARMYLDLAAVVQGQGAEMNWNWIRGELEELKLLDFAAVALTAVEQWFGVKRPMALPPVKREVLERFRIFTMEAGVYGHHQREQGINALKHQGNADNGSRLAVLGKRLFPPAEALEERYTYLQDKPWLLPAAWVHRVVKTRDKLGQHTHEAKVILSADEAQVAWLQQISREIGL